MWTRREVSAGEGRSFPILFAVHILSRGSVSRLCLSLASVAMRILKGPSPRCTERHSFVGQKNAATNILIEEFISARRLSVQKHSIGAFMFGAGSKKKLQ